MVFKELLFNEQPNASVVTKRHAERFVAFHQDGHCIKEAVAVHGCPVWCAADVIGVLLNDDYSGCSGDPIHKKLKQEDHEGLCSTGMVNRGSIVFTSCFIAILTISRTINQSCMGRSGWFAKGTKFSPIFNY